MSQVDPPDPARVGVPALAAYRARMASDEPDASVDGFAELFAAGREADVVPPLPPTPAEAAAHELAPQQIRVVRDRLRRLGYTLVESAVQPAEEWSPGLASAVAGFQSEASLASTGRVSVETWDRLRELFDFETRLRLEWCFADGEACAALRRALRLRIATLGFGEPPARDTAAAPAFAALGAQAQPLFAALRALGVTEVSIPTEHWSREAVEVVFNHEGLVETFARLPDNPLAAQRPAARTLLICVAKIELWLLGYEGVEPDGDDELARRQVGPLRRPGLGMARSPDWRETSTGRALRHFLADTGTPVGAQVRGRPPPLASVVLPALFRRTRALRAEQRAVGQREDIAHEVVDRFIARLQQEPGFWTRLWEHVRRLGNVLFDGIRRAIAWVGSMLRRVASVVWEQAVNVWRVVHHFMGSTAYRLTRAFRAFTAGAAFLFQSRQASDPPGHVESARRRDFDLVVAMADQADSIIGAAWAERLVWRARAFAIACRMISLAARTTRRVVMAGGLGVVGLLPLVLALARINSELRELARDLDALGEGPDGA